MLIEYDTEKLKTTLEDFSNATGINIMLLREDFSMAVATFAENGFCRAIHHCPQGRIGCKDSDDSILQKCARSKKAEMHVCHAGLIDIAVPVLYEGDILAYLILGQMKRDADFSTIESRLIEYTVNIEEMRVFYDGLPLFDSHKMQSVAKIATMLTKYIMLENMLKLRFNNTLEEATRFIEENLDKDLTVDYITKNTNISKSVLYKNFRDTYNCTISEYINRKRVEKAVVLLVTTDLSIEEVSEKIGFSSAAYFAIVFKKQKGISPLKFRKATKDIL